MGASRRTLRALVGATVLGGAAALVACGLDAVGLAPGEGSSDATSSDASTDAGPTSKDGAVARDADILSDADAADADGGDGLVDPYSTRVSTGLVALYELEDATGATVSDKVAPSYDLTIADVAKVAWHPHYLEITDYTSLSNAATFDKLVAEVQTTHEVTVEAWVKITSVSGGGSSFGRLVSIIEDANTRDIDMGQHGKNLWASMLSSSTQIEKGPVAANLSHVVLTRTASDATMRLYLNGVLYDSASGVGDPASFVAYRMFVANSFNGDRGIVGELHLLAFYENALSPAQVATNFAAGPDPSN